MHAPIHRFRITENPSRFSRISTCHYGIPPFQGCSISGIHGFRDQTFERHRIKHFGIGTFFPKLNVPESTVPGTFPKATMEWKNGSVNRAKGEEKEKKKRRGKKMSIYLALTKKKKKFFNRSNCRFKRRGNLEPRGSIEPRVNFPETLPSPSPLFFILLLFFSLSPISAMH